MSAAGSRPDDSNIVHALEAPVQVITYGPPPAPEHYVAAYSPHAQDVHSINDASLTQPININLNEKLVLIVAIVAAVFVFKKVLK
jgi:hypothetical protein